MPTQEELNAAQMELDIANDNYAAMANRYNKFQDLFKAYAKASPEMQDKAAESIWYALEEFYKLQQDMYAAEDRIQQAQNKWNNYNEIMAKQPQQTTPSQPTIRRRVITPNETIVQPEPKPLNNGPLEVINTNRVKPIIDNPVLDRLTEQQYVDSYRRPPVNAVPAIITNNEWIYWTLSPAPSVPQEIQNVQRARGRDYLRWMKDLENNYWYRVFNQKAYDNHWNVYSLK